jgi:hypothetical protein
MKNLLFLLCFTPTICLAQTINTKTMYKAYTINESPTQPIIEEIKTFNQAGQLIQIITMGIADPNLASYDTLVIVSSIGADSMVIVAKEAQDFSKPATKEILTYANSQLATNTTINYFITNTKLDSTIEILTYQYLPKNIVKKSTLANGVTTTKQYVQDANGIKISDRYIFKLDKTNKLLLKYTKSENKKTARIEKYTYYTFGKRKEFIIQQSGKTKSVTTYTYNDKQELVLEKTKNIDGKKTTIDTITYEYTNGNCTKETTHTNGETDSVVEYSYTFF